MTPQLLTSPWTAAAGQALLHFVWQGAAVAMALGILLALLGDRYSRVRYLLCCAALAVMAALPIATLAVVMDRPVPAETAFSAVQPTARNVPAPQGPSNDELVQPAVLARARAQAIAQGNFGALVAREFRLFLHRLSPWLPLAWGLGVALMSLRLLAGAWGVRTLRRSGLVEAPAAWHVELAHLAESLRLKRRVALWVSERVPVPLLTGWLKPAVLLPQGLLERLTPLQVRLLLAHELIHVRRLDPFMNLFQTLIETLLFYHPAVWWVSGRIRDAREHCCDDAAVALCRDPLAYAEALSAVAHLKAAPAWTLSATGGKLMSRIRRLLEPSCAGPQGASRGFAGLAALVVAVGLLVAARNTAAQQTPAHYVTFPEAYSLGQLYIRNAGTPYNVSITSSGNGEGWRTYGQAAATVEVPANTELMLRVHPQAVSSLEDLKALGPDDLQKLDLTECGLKDEDLAHIKHLTGLKSLSLKENRELTDACLEHLKDMTSLVWLSLEVTQATCDSTLFDGLTELQYLDVYGTRLTDAGFERLCRLPKLKSLGIELAKVTPETLASLEKLQHLEEVNLENTQTNDAAVSALAALPKLRYLNTARTAVTDAGMASLAKAPVLEVLNVKFTTVSDAGVQALENAPRLRHLETDGSQVTDEGLKALKEVMAGRETGPVEAQRSTNPNAPRVGLVMSHYTATGPHWIAKPYGYQHQFSVEMASILEEANFDVYAVIEPGTEKEGELPDVLAACHLTQKTINGADPQALSQLNVIFTKSLLNVREEMIDALSAAVRNGTGLVAMGDIGSHEPGVNEELSQLLGVNQPELYFNLKLARCRVIASHPILGALKPGDTITLNMLHGYKGTVRGQTLMASDEPEDPKDFFPLYVSSLGKGRVVGIQWFNPHLPDAPFDARGDLYVRAVNWAANQPADAQW